MDRFSDALLTAVRQAAAEVPERTDKPGFLESTLEAAIVRRLPSVASIVQGRRRFALPGYEPSPLGVDIDWAYEGHRLGIEVKVWDVLDSLFDIVKLATAIATTDFTAGFCVIAALSSHWENASPVREMTEAVDGQWHEHGVEDLLSRPRARGAVLVVTGPRPRQVPARLQTKAFAPVDMPKAPGHTVRVLAVRPTAGASVLTLPDRPSA